MVHGKYDQEITVRIRYKCIAFIDTYQVIHAQDTCKPVSPARDFMRERTRARIQYGGRHMRRYISHLPVFCRYYLCDAMMLIKPSMTRPWATGITTLEVAIVIANFVGHARMNTVKMCRMRERIEQDARTSLLMRERTLIVRWVSFY